jgi:hypothetical protein
MLLIGRVQMGYSRDRSLIGGDLSVKSYFVSDWIRVCPIRCSNTALSLTGGICLVRSHGLLLIGRHFFDQLSTVALLEESVYCISQQILIGGGLYDELYSLHD